MERDLKIDILKTILIVSVVLGHAASTKGDLDHNIVFLNIYSWHMFLFMAVSGFLVGKKTDVDGEWIKKRIRRLMLPLACWAAIKLLISGQFSLLLLFDRIVINPVYWYLLVQFIFEMQYYWFLKTKYRSIPIVLPILMFSFIYVTFVPCRSLQQILLYYPFYWTGVMLSNNGNAYSWFGKYKWMSLIIYPLSMILYSWKDYTRVSHLLYRVLHIFHIPEKVIEFTIRLGEIGGFKVYNHYIVSPLGCAFFVCIAALLANIKNDYIKKMTILGKNTMYIYILHDYMLRGLTKFITNIYILTGLAIVGSMFFAFFIKKIPALNCLLFGEISKKSN